jgi:hypothetical protein
LIVASIDVAQLDFGIGRNLDRLVVLTKVGNVDRKTIGAHGRDGPQSRLIAIDRCQLGKPIRGDYLMC